MLSISPFNCLLSPLDCKKSKAKPTLSTRSLLYAWHLAQVLAYLSVQKSLMSECINESVTALFGRPSKPDKLVLRGERIACRSFPHGWGLSSHPQLYVLLTCAEGSSVGRCVHKTWSFNCYDWNKTFQPTQAILKKLNCFPEPAIFTEVWNLALKTGWAISNGYEIGVNHTGLIPEISCSKRN